MVMEMVEVVGNVDIEFGSISEGEGGLELGFHFDLLDSLSDEIEFGTRLYLRRFRFGQGLYRPG